MNLKPIKNSIIFTFVDPVNAKGEFEKGQTQSGIVLKSSFDDSAKSPRWVNIVAVGPDCKYVKPGMQALLPNLRWTSHVKHEGNKYWRSDENEVVGIRQNQQDSIHPINEWVVFEKSKPAATTTASGIILMYNVSDDNASGKVVSIGDKVEQELANRTFYFDDTNFTDTFTQGTKELSFIKQENVLIYVAD